MDMLSAVVWNGVQLGEVRGENVPCRFCGGIDGNGHLFGRLHLSPVRAFKGKPRICFVGIVNCVIMLAVLALARVAAGTGCLPGWWPLGW